MKIVIEQHTCHTGMEERVFYCVRYKKKWSLLWRYVKHTFRDGKPETKEFCCLAEAKNVASSLRTMYSGPKHTVEELDERGNPLLPNSSGG